MACLSDTACPDGYRELSSAELRELLQDEAKMEEIIRSEHKLQKLQLQREDLLSSNRALAELSLAKRPQLNSGKIRLCDKYRDLSNLATTCAEKQSQLEERGHSGSLQSLHSRVQEEVVQTDDSSEDLLERFMDCSLSLEDFLPSFSESRRVYHVRRAQAEKLQELSGRSRASPPSPHSQKLSGRSRASPPSPRGAPPPQLRLFQVLAPAILVPGSGSAPAPPPLPPPAALGLRLIGQLPGGWAGGRAVRVQQLYRPSPAHSEPPCR